MDAFKRFIERFNLDERSVMWTQTGKWLGVLGATAAFVVLGAGCDSRISDNWNAPLRISAPVAGAGELAYLNRGFEQVHVVSAKLDEGQAALVTVRLETGSEPGKIARSADGKTLFVVNEGDKTLRVYDRGEVNSTSYKDVVLGGPYDRISVDPEGEFVLLSYTGANFQNVIAQNLNEIAIVDLRAGVPEVAEFTTLFNRPQGLVFAPAFELAGKVERLAASLSPSEITLIDLLADNELDRLRSVPLTISQADAVRNPQQVVFDTSENPSAPDTISVYVLTDRGEDITQILVQPSLRADAGRKFDVSINQLAAGPQPVKMAALELPEVGTRLLVLNGGQQPRFTMIDVASGESATFELPITSAPTDLLVFKTLAAGAERAETRVLAYSTRSPLAAVIRPESITVSGDAPTAGRTVEAIRLRQPPERIVMADEAGGDRAIAFHKNNQDGFSVINLRTNRAIPIQGYSLSDLTFAGSLGYGVFSASPNLVVFDLETGHPTVFELPASGQRIFVQEGALIVQHSGNTGRFTVLDAGKPVVKTARVYENVFLEGLFAQELP